MELIWTTEPPSEAGYYWHRKAGYGPVIHQVYDTGFGLCVDPSRRRHWWVSVDTFGGEWAGPIPLPKERSDATNH